MIISIRPAELNDLESICALDCSCFADPWSEKQWQSEIAKHPLFVMQRSNQVQGLALAHLCLDEFELLKIAVAPTAQNSGYGYLILQFLQDEIRKQGVIKGFLEVRLSNISAKNLYLKLGWTEIGVRKGYYSDGEHASLMEVIL